MSTLRTLAFAFPGQGSQSVGMLAGLARHQAQIQETFAEASSRLEVALGPLVQHGPEEQLNRTENTQPALLAAGVAVWRVWLSEGGPRPALLAGHSLGEYSALVAAGSLSLADGAWLVAERGRLMQEAVPPGIGAMAAILGLDDESVGAACAEAAADQVVSAANLNAPGQVVIAGHRQAVDRAVELAKARGARRAVPLAVSVPSHCALMQPAAEKMERRLDEIDLEPPQIPVIHNADVAHYQEPADIRRALIRQLVMPVRWVETIAHLRGAGIETFIECGPGKVLCGLIRRIERELAAHPVDDDAALATALSTLAK